MLPPPPPTQNRQTTGLKSDFDIMDVVLIGKQSTTTLCH